MDQRTRLYLSDSAIYTLALKCFRVDGKPQVCGSYEYTIALHLASPNWSDTDNTKDKLFHACQCKDKSLLRLEPLNQRA